VSVAAHDGIAVFTLRLADDCLVLSHRLAQWSSRAPTLEEDVALTNIALDLLGQGRSLYALAAGLDGSGRSEDEYAYGRDERQFLNCQLVEQENGDFAQTVARQLLYSTFQQHLWSALEASRDETLAAIAAKALTEVRYHVDHATRWTLRLGDGTVESHERMQAALERLWPYTAELFEDDDVVANGGVEPRLLRAAWEADIDAVLTEATLQRPEPAWAPSGGRRGIHTESFGYMLAEMQHLHRCHPGATW